MAKFEYPELLNEMLASKFINVQKHPQYPLWLYNYSKRVQHRELWNEATCACRGMIMDAEQNIISRPFKKFFNYWEIDLAEIPDEPFAVTDKVDGSLGISYYYKGVWQIATRGSFAGKHATKANQILHQKYSASVKQMRPELTYLFEIIYPENRIIVDYGEREELILLAVIDTETGAELVDYEDIGFPLLKTFDNINSFADVLKLREQGAENAEGFVLRFASGYRLKVKFEEYMRLHSIMLGLTETKVWQYLSKGNDTGKLFDIATEEQRHWLNTAIEKIRNNYTALYQEVTDEFNDLLKNFPSFKNLESLDKKLAAEQITGRKNETFLFNLLNDKPIEKMIWQYVKPDENASWFAGRG
ncbi:MAG: T4 RnlA family RNA ligase [Paludibacter sp.]|jgi:RNA ligase|nr:T4 RnlA family RNA ligase [Paludibacter sp.]